MQSFKRFWKNEFFFFTKMLTIFRIDTTLLGFDYTTWQRGNRSYIFKGQCTKICFVLKFLL